MGRAIIEGIQGPDPRFPDVRLSMDRGFVPCVCLRRDVLIYLSTYISMYVRAQLPPAAATMKHFIGYGNSRNG
jgi:hypothetical protein